jgi:hypothetical protein
MLITSLLLVKLPSSWKALTHNLIIFKIHAQFAHQLFLTFEKYLFTFGDPMRDAMLPFIDNLDFFGK